jgi:hypothetical protein
LLHDARQFGPDDAQRQLSGGAFRPVACGSELESAGAQAAEVGKAGVAGHEAFLATGAPADQGMALVDQRAVPPARFCSASGSGCCPSRTQASR